MNDLNRLLDEAVPEPRRPLAAADLVRRARRRRATRTAALGAVTAVAVVAGVAVANGVTDGPARPPFAATLTPSPEPTPSATTTVSTTEARWPEDTSAHIRCAETYPAGLVTKPIAFAGTVAAVRYGSPDAYGEVVPVSIDFTVEREITSYGIGPTITLTTDSGLLPARRYSIVGTRVLAATGHERVLLGCGFTRTYDDTGALLWGRMLAPGPDRCYVSSEGQPPERDAREYVGLRVEDAERLAASRNLSSRRIGDGVTGVRDDLRTDRVNLCNRDGVVTSAAIF